MKVNNFHSKKQKKAYKAIETIDSYFETSQKAYINKDENKEYYFSNTME